MEKIKFIQNFNKVHFIGIGGISMSALACYSLANGIAVSGSDTTNSEQVDLLRSLGAKISIGHKKSIPSGVDAVVYTSAISSDNLELSFAEKNGIKIYKRSQFLGEIAKDFKTTVAVCGSHGKTTTTAMVAEILIASGVNPTIFLGGESSEFGNFKFGTQELILLEACEYKKNFLDIFANVVLVTNVDNDHLDSYTNIEEQVQSVNEFIKHSVAFVNADDVKSKALTTYSLISYAINNPANYQAKFITQGDGKVAFSVYAYGRRLGRINLQIGGIYNVYNALLAFAYANEKGVPFLCIKKALEKFEGVKRRNEYLGEFLGKKCYADYAHHPCEIDNLIKSVGMDDKVLYVFQPHTYSRTKFLIEEFCSVLSKLSNLIIYKTYPAREKYDVKGSAKIIYKRLKLEKRSVKYSDNPEELERIINKQQNVEKIYFVGAGDIYNIAIKNFVKKSSKKLI